MEAHCSESNNEAFNCGEADKYVQLALQAKMDSNTEQMWKYLKKALKLNPLLKGNHEQTYKHSTRFKI